MKVVASVRPLPPASPPLGEGVKGYKVSLTIHNEARCNSYRALPYFGCLQNVPRSSTLKVRFKRDVGQILVIKITIGVQVADLGVVMYKRSNPVSAFGLLFGKFHQSGHHR